MPAENPATPKARLSSHLGRTLRAIRDDDVAARSYGIALDRYKSLAFGVAGFSAGIARALMAHIVSYVNHETFTSQGSRLALAMVILGGLGNLPGAIIGAVMPVSLPELFRAGALAWAARGFGLGSYLGDPQLAAVVIAVAQLAGKVL